MSRAAQHEALMRLWNLANQDHGASRVAVKLLLGLYNGDRFPFDLTDLRLLDDQNLMDALAVLVMDSRPQREVHEELNLLLHVADMGPRFEQLAWDWRLKGKASKADIEEYRLRVALRTGAAA